MKIIFTPLPLHFYHVQTSDNNFVLARAQMLPPHHTMASNIMHDGEFNHVISNMVDDHIAEEGIHHHVNNQHGIILNICFFIYL